MTQAYPSLARFKPEIDICLKSHSGYTLGLWSIIQLSDQEDQLSSHLNQQTSKVPWMANVSNAQNMLIFTARLQKDHVSGTHLGLWKGSKITHCITTPKSCTLCWLTKQSYEMLKGWGLAPPYIPSAWPRAWGLRVACSSRLVHWNHREYWGLPVNDNGEEVRTLILLHFRGKPRLPLPWPFLVSPELFR